MNIGRVFQRLLLRADAMWREVRTLFRGDLGSHWDAHTTVTFRAVTDAVLPETPALGDELGPEHVPGGLEIELDEFLVTYVDNLFQFGLPYVGPQGNIPLATSVAHILDAAALALIARNENESEPNGDRVARLLSPDDLSPLVARVAAGKFAKLSRRDRLRAIAILDEFDIEIEPFDETLFEVDAGFIGQLVIGFAEMIYYSEWQGYDRFRQPPSQREHPNDPAAVQSWRQTGYPGVADGYAALRGYVGTDEGPLGAGDVWATIDGDATDPVRIMHQSGSFRENEYDTSDYEEPFPEEVA